MPTTFPDGALRILGFARIQATVLDSNVASGVRAGRVCR
jgi:hypothetical protein